VVFSKRLRPNGLENDMTTATTAPAVISKSVAVTIIGLITLLLGGAYAAFGGFLIFAGASWLGEPRKDPWEQMATLFGILPAFAVLIGVAFLPPGILGLLAGLGVLLRQQWGRILTFLLAVLAILLGLGWVAGSDWDATDIALGAAQVLYGILAFVTLIVRSAEFSGLSIPGAQTSSARVMENAR
jgi:hypothetical protein